MDNETKSEIELILDRVNSINELDRGHLCQLRATLAGRFAIEKFEVTNSEWCQWIEKRGYENIRGVEYDAHRNRLIVKATQSVLHETSTEVISAWFRTVARELQNATSSKFQNVRSTWSDLSGDCEGTRKVPDEGISQGSNPYPLIALEIAVSEPATNIPQDVEKWLKGTEGETKLVIAVDIQENLSRKERKTTATTWGLSDKDIPEFTVGSLRKHILHWHKQENIPLLGEFTAYVYFCFHDQPQRLVWEYTFSLHESQKQTPLTRDTCSFTAKDLLPEFEGTLDFVLPLEELSEEIRNCLERHEAQQAATQARRKLIALKEASKFSQSTEAE